MTYIRNCGEFLNTLNNSGRFSRIIKTTFDFEDGTDPEIIKLNSSISIAKKIGTCIISRLDKNANYLVGLGDSTILSTFLNNEYIGVLALSGNIHEFKNLGARDYTYNKEIDILSCFVDDVETYDSSKKNFNEAVKSAHKYQVVLRDSATGKYRSEFKGTDDAMIQKILDSDYIGIFTKSGTLAEFKKTHIRKTSNITPPPALYSSGIAVDTSVYIPTNVHTPALPIIPPAKVVSKPLTNFNHYVNKTDDFTYVKFKNGEFSIEFGYIHNLNFISNMIDNNYVGFRVKNKKLLEYYNLGTSVLNMNVSNERLKDFGFDKMDDSYAKSIASAILVGGSRFLFRYKKGAFSSNQYTHGSKSSTVLSGVDYFAHLSIDGKITEFIKIGEREITDTLPLPNLNFDSDNILEIEFNRLINKNFKVIKFKHNSFQADSDVMWNYGVQGSSYFAFKVGNKIFEYYLAEVREITSSMLPSSELKKYGLNGEFKVAFQHEIKDVRTRFMTRMSYTSYIGGTHLNSTEYGKADYIGVISNDRRYLHEFVKVNEREVSPNMKLPNLYKNTIQYK